MEKTNSQFIDLMPTDIVKLGNTLLIHLIDPQRLDLSRGFLKQSIPKDRPVDQLVPLQDWLNARADELDNQDFSNTNIIFHVARCGSTLLTQNLKATDQCIVLSEPKILGLLLHRFEQIMDRELYLQSLQTTIAVWQNWALQQNKLLIIKLSSLAHRALEDIFEYCLNSRFLFLFREPVAVIESLSRHPPGFVSNKKTYNDQEELIEFTGYSDDTIAYNAANSYCSAINKFTGLSDPRFTSIDYKELETQFPNILKHFNIHINSTAIQWNSDIYAKWKGEAPIKYEPIALQLIEKFEKDEEKLLEISKLYYDKYLRKVSQKSILQ